MHLTRRTLAAIAAAAALCLTAGACSSSASNTGLSSGEQLQNQQQQADTNQLEYTIPLPNFPFSEIRQELVEIEAIQALGIQSTSFIFVLGIDHPVLVCPSVGVPVPATDELSNPVTPLWSSGSNGSNSYGIAGVTVGQQDPTGVYSGPTTGTNGLCLNNAGLPYDAYNEAEYITVTADAYWDQAMFGGKGGIHVTGTPVMPVCKVTVLNASKHTAQETCTKPAGTRSIVRGRGLDIPVTYAKTAA